MLRAIYLLLGIAINSAVVAGEASFKLMNEVISIENGESLSVQSGRIKVPENRMRPNGRTVSLPFYRIPSKNAEHDRAIFILAGGPGSSGIAQASNQENYQAIKFYQEFADVVVFDQRGAGGSMPNLQCEGRYRGEDANPVDAAFASKVIREVSSACHKHWSDQSVDLTAYNTHESAADVNDLRVALGYESISLIGGSYGSHLGLHVIRRYPDAVDRALFYGVEGPDHTYDIPTHVYNAMQRIARHAEASGLYDERLPDGGLMEALEVAIQRVEDKPARVELKRGDKVYEVWVSGLAAKMVAKRSAGSRDNPQRWPELVLAMYEGDYKFAAMATMGLRTMRAPNAMKYMMDHSSGVSEGRRQLISIDPVGHILGNLSFDLIASEHVWQAMDLGAAYRRNVEVDVPVLLIHGTWDVSTPIENARDVAGSLKNGHLIEVIGGNHGGLFNLYADWPDAWNMVRDFFTGVESDFPKQIRLELPRFPDKVVLSEAQVKLWEACISGNIAEAETALKNGADINALDTRKSRSGRRALNWAAYNNHPGMIKLLIKYGADINRSNHTGYTPLHHAVESGSLESVELLLRLGANPDITTKKGITPLQTAQRKNFKAIQQLIL